MQKKPIRRVRPAFERLGFLRKAMRRTANRVSPKRYRMHCARRIVLPALLKYFGGQLKFAMVSGSVATKKTRTKSDLDIKIITDEAGFGFRDAKSNPGLREILGKIEQEIGFKVDVKEWGQDYVASFPSLWQGKPIIIFGQNFAEKQGLLK